MVIPKMPFLETEGAFDAMSRSSDKFVDLSLEWEDDIPYKVLNDGFLGPTPQAVVKMYVDIFSRVDEVDIASEMPGSDMGYGPIRHASEPLPCSTPRRAAAAELAAALQHGLPQSFRPVGETAAAASHEGGEGRGSAAHFCALPGFEDFPRDVVERLGVQGEACAVAELAEIRARCLRVMTAWEAATTLYYSCAGST